MNIKTWSNFSKRRNSTKQPAIAGTDVTCTLKEATSIESPTFVLSSNDFTINYIQAFGHYYFVNDIKSVRNGVIEVSCTQDVLATYKSEIGSYNCYIERSQSAYDNMLADPMVSLKNSVTSWQSGTPGSTNNLIGIFDDEGTYIVSVLNDKGSGTGYTSYYLIGVGAMEKLAAFCNSSPASTAVDLTDWFTKNYLKIPDSVIDCKWTPLSWTTVQNLGSSLVSAEQMRIGNSDISVQGQPVNAYRILKPFALSHTAVSVTLNHRYSDFRKANPYTRGLLNLPYYGFWEFNPLDFESNVITVQYVIDPACGDTLVVIGGDKTVATLRINLGLTVPVGRVLNQVGQGMTSFITGASGIAAAIASGGTAAAVSGIASAAGAVNGLATAALGISPSVHGATEGRAGTMVNRSVYAILTFSDTTDPSDLLPEHGRILLDKRTISTLSGYVQCGGASLDVGSFEEDKERINSFLNSGFYYE